MNTLLGDNDFEFNLFFEHTPDLVCIANKEGYFKKVNAAVLQKLEYDIVEIYQHPVSYFMYPEDIERTKQTRQEMLNGAPLLNFQNRYVSKSGKIIWLEWTSIYFPERDIVFAIAKDITSKKTIELEVENKYAKFKGLATHFKQRIEKDRSFLAYELHEELAQLASVVKMDIDMITLTETNLSTSAQEKLQHAAIITGLLVKTIQRISFAVSPGMLKEFGLEETIRFMAKEFGVLNGIACFVETDFKESQLSDEEKIDFFRVCQESLTNIMYHAGATHVNILLKGTEKDVILSISDNGKGFETTVQLPNSGLASMKERADSINAQLSINSNTGEGTNIKLKLLR